MRRPTFGFFVLAFVLVGVTSTRAGQLRAGAAKVDVTDREAGPVNDPLFVRALVLETDETRAVLITVDAVAIGEIGPIGNAYLPTVRKRLQADLAIAPQHVVVNASHCHGLVVKDVAARTVRAVERAVRNLVPVTVGVGVGHEDRIMANRRLRLKDGRTVDVRHAYALPPGEEVVGVGPIDPDIGVLRLDRQDGKPIAVVYNFACHPIQGAAGGGNTADITGFASKVIEDNLGHGAIALFVQGCGGDINPAFYKSVALPRDAEPLGNMLGLATLAAVRKIVTRPDPRLKIVNEALTLPRGDRSERIAEMETRREKLLNSLTGTTLNFETFLPLAVKYKLAPDSPSYASHRYLHEKRIGREHLRRLDDENRRNMAAYVKNVRTMEELTRLQTNLRLLRRHQRTLEAVGRTIDVEVVGLRVGDFVLTTFPGELTVQIGLNVKQQSPHEHTFVAGYTNGYVYYAPTAQQLKNVGNAQEDSDCVLAPEWQALFEKHVAEMLKSL